MSKARIEDESVINVPSIAAKRVHITKTHVLIGCKNNTSSWCPIYRNAGTVHSVFSDQGQLTSIFEKYLFGR